MEWLAFLRVCPGAARRRLARANPDQTPSPVGHPGPRSADRLAAPLARFLERLPPVLAASFTPEQLEAINWHFAMRYRTTHIIDYRGRCLGFYLVFFAGRDYRTKTMR
jgi:hypothetical protein